MRTFWKATLAALSITAFAGVAGGANAQPTGYDNGRAAYDDRYDNGDPYAADDDRYGANGYGYDGYGYDQPPGGIAYDYDTGGYCDDYGCPDDFYDLPVYYGPVYYDGLWFDGPLYYRDWYGRRQYWVHGGWHYDTWRGARPAWYREGRYGPALGRSFYSSNQFRGGFTANRRDFGRNDFNRPNFNNRQDFNRNGGSFNNGFRQGLGGNSVRNDANRSFGNNRSFAAPQARAQAAPQVQQDRGQRFGGQGFQRSEAARPDFRNRGDFNRGNFQRNDAAPRPQAQRNEAPRNDGGNRDRGGDHGDRHR